MRLKNVPGSREAIADSVFVIHEPETNKGAWQQVFGNDHEIHVEIGMGKGRFLYEMASLHPDINYIGIEKYSSVLLRAIQKMEEKELPNLRFVRMDAEDITEVFGRDEIDRIYLNFSDPWPKDRHAKRRLPSRQFLARYDEFLKGNGVLEFKTDNRDLFDFAVEEVPEAGWKIKECTYDLHHDDRLMQGNVMTEYEEKFSSIGNPICKYIIYRQNDTNREPYNYNKEKEEILMELKITEQNFEEEVVKSNIPVLVDFYADWCGPCKMMAPVVAELAVEYEGKCKVFKCNVDENMNLAQKYGVMSIPNMIVFKNGEVKANVVGAVSKTDLADKIDSVL